MQIKKDIAVPDVATPGTGRAPTQPLTCNSELIDLMRPSQYAALQTS
jgi:hypothetical protein